MVLPLIIGAAALIGSVGAGSYFGKGDTTNNNITNQTSFNTSYTYQTKKQNFNLNNGSSIGTFNDTQTATTSQTPTLSAVQGITSPAKDYTSLILIAGGVVGAYLIYDGVKK